ncbi:MAG: MarR family winged helix-turn-helix transcriptional regulator [Trebonia sp.]
MSKDRNPALSPDPTLRHTMRQVVRAFSAKMSARLAEYGVSEAEYASLFALRRIPNMSNADLSRWIGISPQGANEVLKSLIASGMVDRHPAPSHGRILEACLTERGEVVIAACEDAGDALEAEMCSELEPHEVALLEDLLRRCVHGLGGRINDRGLPPVRLARSSSRSRV